MNSENILLNDWHPVATAASLEENALISVVLLDQPLVIWRAGETLCAWHDSCVHRGTKLSLGKVVDGDCVQCPYHGWIYNSHGRCVHIPAMPDHKPSKRAQLKTYSVQEKYGWIWVCLGQPKNDVAEFPEWDKTEFRKLFCGPYQVNTSGPRVIENFLDVSHFPYVHENILGTQAETAIADYKVTTGRNGVKASNVQVYQPDPYGTGQGDTVAYTYLAPRPLTAYLLKESEGPQFSILLAVTPHTETECTAFMWMTMNYGHDIPEKELVDWQDSIFAQDKPIVESQQPKRLPLDPKAELSMRSDKTAVSYRRWLAKLGMTYSVEPPNPAL